ncbi:MAG: hypothetical protein WCG04_00585 [Alphaproteobacteria bacterium]
MPTFFSWAADGEDFSPQRHAHWDLEIFQLSIQQNQGEIAFATLLVKNEAPFPVDRQHALIAYGEPGAPQLIFRGRLSGMPRPVGQALLELHFTAEPSNAMEQLLALSETLKQPPYWDTLFIDPLHADHPGAVLEARSASFSWNRLTGAVILSDLFTGHEHAVIEDDILENSLKVNIGEPPLDEVHVRLMAEWVQTLDDEADLAPALCRRFSRGMINTLTPQSLKNSWPKPYTKLGRSGYTILESSLQEVTPPSTGALNLYPTISPNFMSWDETQQKSVMKRAARCWFRAKLAVGWSYKQKRREIVSFTLKQATIFGTTGKKRQLALCLQAVGDGPRASFFMTDRGHQAIEHAVEIARCHLAGTARCLEVELMIPFAQGLALTTDHSITVKAPQLPHGQLTGKLISYRLVQEAGLAYTWLRIAVAAGARPEDAPDNIHAEDYASIEYGPLAPQAFHRSESGIVFKDYSEQKPREGIQGVHAFTELIQNIDIHGDGQHQVETVLANQYPLCANPMNSLEAFLTKFQIDLQNIETHDVLEHKITLDIPEPWYPPQQ